MKSLDFNFHVYVCSNETRSDGITRNEEIFRRGRRNKSSNAMKFMGHEGRMGLMGEGDHWGKYEKHVCKCIMKPTILHDNFKKMTVM